MRKSLAVSIVFCLVYTPLLVSAAPPFPQDANGGFFSPEQLDNLVAPVALYPDPLLSQVLLAATFVDQVDEAGRWVRANGPNGIDEQYWDVSVKAVAHYPAVISMMADRLDWTTSLGQAYVSQSTDVMMSIQRLRHMAHSQGNLISTPQQEVIVEGEYIRIDPYQPRYIYVPVYDPAIVYYRRPAFGLAIVFGAGLIIGAWLNHDCDWRGHRVYYHGWEGGGWVGRARPNIQVTNIYINNHYNTVIINRTVVNRSVNYNNLNRYNSVHREVNYNNVRVNNNPRRENRPSVNNKVLNRNVNTGDPKLDKYRGRENQSRPAPPERNVPQRPERPSQQRPAPQPPVRPGPQPQARPEQRPTPHALGRSEGGVDTRASSQRGQSSRAEANRPQPPPQNRPQTQKPEQRRRP